MSIVRFSVRTLISFLLLLPTMVPSSAQEAGSEQTDSVAAAGERRKRALEWFYRQRAYPRGFVPAEYRFEALRQLEALRARRAEAPTPAQELGTGRWTEVGPSNIGGRVLALALHPANDDILYVGTADGGVFKTTDGGQTWQPLTDRLPSLAVKCLLLDPKNPETIYAGTGEGNFGYGFAVGRGVMKSTDGGQTWTLSEPFTDYVNRLAIDPRQTNTVFAATNDGVFKSTDAGATWRAVLRSRMVFDLSLDHENPRVLLAAVWDQQWTNPIENGIWRSVDAGETWARIEAGLPAGDRIGRVSLARAPSDSMVVYAGVSQLSDTTMGIFRSDDGGLTWSQLPDTPSYCGNFCWYTNELTVHPTDTETVFAGGIRLWKSTDGGNTWALSDTGVHVDHHALAISRRNPNVVFDGSDGGVHRSEDGGAAWIGMNLGLQISQFYAIGHAASNPALFYGGTQDNGTLRSVGASSFQQVVGGDGMVTLVDPTDAQFVYAEAQFGFLRRSIDGGLTFLNLSSDSPVFSTDRFNWVAPFTLDPSNPRVLYFGTHRLYKSTNRAVSWTRISDDLTRNLDPAVYSYLSTITAIAVAPSDPRTIYVGTADGLVWTTTDGGATPSSFRRIIAGLPDRWVTRLAVHPRDGRVVYATFSGFNSEGGVPGHVFRSADGGATWNNISSNLPDLPVNVVVIDPLNPVALFIGTDLGCFRSANGGASWEPFNDGLPNSIVFDLAFFGNTSFLRAATFGRGIWQYVTPERAPASIAVVAGDAQRAAPGADLGLPVQVAVLDAQGAPVPEVAVTFELEAGAVGGIFADGSTRASAVTDRNGVATMPPPRLGREVGVLSIQAGAAGVARSARISVETIAAPPRLTRALPGAAAPTPFTADNTAIGAGQNVALEGSGLRTPITVFYVQNGALYPTTTNTSIETPERMYSSLPTGLVPGKASVLISRGRDLSSPVELTITRGPAAPVFEDLFQIAPSPG